jgi:MFS transporter, ACS family, D-galactonate transporter
MTFRGDDLTFTTDPVWAIFWISITLSGLAAAVGWSIPSSIAPRSGTATIGGITNLLNVVALINDGLHRRGYAVLHRCIAAAGNGPVVGIVAHLFVFILGRLEPIADPPAT